ncbi:GNAT family N-acetyltransferase [Brachybacterium tyrofermentans]|uniref:GNAT family N-acetyltransferase n=1 Tax=Brachybacterium tyrofermentans TaxID=47848 RepID=UPI003FB91FC3
MISAKVLAPDDWPVWRELRLRALADAPEAFGSTFAEVLSRDTEQHWRAAVSAPMVSFIVETADGPAGMARIMFPEQSDTLPELISVWVAPEARGTGASRALLAACVDHLAAHHPMTRLRLAVVETNMPARRLYESCGFGVIGRNPDDDTELLMERRAAPMDQQHVELPTELVVRYRAVDREHVGTPTLDTPAHLDRLTELIGREGMRTPIDLAFNEEFATIDGNHRIAVARRLGLATVPVHLTRRAAQPRPGHGRDMDPADLGVLEAALAPSPALDLDHPGRGTGIVA